MFKDKIIELIHLNPQFKLLKKAYKYTLEKHTDSLKNGKINGYHNIFHMLEVANKMIEYFETERSDKTDLECMVTTALLHDAEWSILDGNDSKRTYKSGQIAFNLLKDIDEQAARKIQYYIESTDFGNKNEFTDENIRILRDLDILQSCSHYPTSVLNAIGVNMEFHQLNPHQPINLSDYFIQCRKFHIQLGDLLLTEYAKKIWNKHSETILQNLLLHIDFLNEI